MLKFCAKVFLGIFLSLSSSLSAFAGAGSSAGGADSLAPSAGSAWFVGGKTIKVCTQVADDFGMPSGTDPQKMIQTVFANWQKYLSDKRIEAGRESALKLAFDLTFLSSCDGTQDLAFYFGENNDDVNQAKSLFNDPYAFSFRKTFDSKIGWGNGFVWVKGSNPKTESPTLWQDPLRLQAILMHEVGHILGCDHVSGTVMNASIGELIASATYTAPNPGKTGENPIQYFANHVDGSTQLVWCIGCDTVVHGEIGTPKRFEAKPGFDPKITFKRFVGRDAVGKISAIFNMELNESNDQHPFKSLSIVLHDEKGSTTLPLLMRNGVVGFDQSNGSYAFSVYSEAGKTAHGTGSLTAVGVALQGFTRDANQKLVPISIAVNSGTNYSWIQIDYADSLNDLPLFRAPSVPEW